MLSYKLLLGNKYFTALSVHYIFIVNCWRSNIIGRAKYFYNALCLYTINKKYYVDTQCNIVIN